MIFLYKQIIIKTVNKILLTIVLVVISIPTILFITINSNRVQNAVIQRVTTILAETLGNHISTGNISISRFNKVNIHDLLVTDLYGDTALYTPELIGRLNLFTFSSRNIDFRKVVLNSADFRLYTDPKTDEISIKFITDRFKSDDSISTKPKLNLGIRSIEFINCRFSFKNETKTFDKPFGVDYADMDVLINKLIISNFKLLDDNVGGAGVGFHIRHLSGFEKSGIHLNLLSADFLVNKKIMSFKNLNICTIHSKLYANEISFHFDMIQDLSDDFITKVNMIVDIQSANVDFYCFSYFVPYFGMYSGSINVIGKVTGTVEDMKGENINVTFGEKTHINGNFDLKGLPDIWSTLIYADIIELVTCPHDIELIKIAGAPGHVVLPVTMLQFDFIEYKGNFTGFFDDFVTYGKFTTNLGAISTDLSIKPVVGSNKDTTFTFRGALKTENFHLGKLLIQPNIGDINMSGRVEGSVSSGGIINADIEGNIGSIELKNYNYQNIPVNGSINNRTYDGHATIDEPNIKVDFSGKVDMTETIPSFDFFANVERAQLFNLKLVENDSSSFAAFKIEAVFSGTNIDNLSGELNLENSLFRRKNREIEINDLLIFTKAIRDTNRFIVRSDIFDAQIWGQYQFLKLSESFFSLVKNFAPSWAPTSVSPDSLSDNSFRFEARFKDTQKLTDFFVDEFSVARGTHIEGHYDPAHRDFHFVLNVPNMMIGDLQLDGLFVNANVEDSTFVIEAGCLFFKPNKNLKFENPTVLARARGDSIGLDVRWNNWDTVLHRGNLSSKIFFERKQKPNNSIIPLIKIFSLPGQIVIANDVWDLKHEGVIIDSTAIKINNFQALKGEQKIDVSGVVSNFEHDNLEISLKDIDLMLLTSTLQFDKLLFDGVANGTAILSNLYRTPVFISDIDIEDFAFNNIKLGDTNLNATWDSYNRSVRVEAQSLLDDFLSMQIGGNFFVADQSLNFDVSINDVSVNILKPYLDDLFKGLEGTLSGNINVNGHISDPIMNGSIQVQRAALILDYTKTRYTFSGNASVVNNSIILKGIELFDRNKNSCKIADGYIAINDLFQNISYDLQFQVNNMEVLNTDKRDNNMFYGNIFATGVVIIKGNPQNVQFDITGRTERGSRFFLPLSSSDELSKTSFITFVDQSAITQRQERSLRSQNRRTDEVLTNETVPGTNLAININLEVTPDAETQLIFDEKIGDIMRARGRGNLNMIITGDRFDMKGTYTIEEGDYLFTVQRLLSGKYFTIEKGGIITWSGDPLGALLNLKATYTTRTSLFTLMNDENFKQLVPVECIMYITNILTNPNVRFELEIPNAGQEVRSFLNAATNSEEEKTRQFLWLLAFNRFYTDPNQMATEGTAGSGLESMGLATASEFLTGQLSNMLSHLSDAVDINFMYRPDTHHERHNYDFDIVTDTWGFHANLERAAENSENVGEFSFDMKVSNSNRLRFKVFNRANATYLSQNPYTQGVGLLFREEFNQLRDLFIRKKPSAIRREDNNDVSDNNQINVKNENKKNKNI